MMNTKHTSVTPTQTAEKDLGTCGSTATVEAKEGQQTGHTPGPWKQSMKVAKQDLAEWAKDREVQRNVELRDKLNTPNVTHAHYGTPCSKIECNPGLNKRSLSPDKKNTTT